MTALPTANQFVDPAASQFDIKLAIAQLLVHLSEQDAIVAAIALAQGAGVVGYATKTAMDADLAHADGAVAFVLNDATAANNTTYRKSGASGTGSWVVTSASYLLQSVFSTLLDYTGYSARSGYAWALVDSNNNIAISVAAAGTVNVGNIADIASRLKLTYNDTVYSRSGFAYVLIDDAGRVGFGVSPSGDICVKGVWYDWSALSQWGNRIAALESVVTPSLLTIDAWGDSLTQGAGSTGGLTYPAQLATLTGRTVNNLGLGSQTSAQIIARQGGNCALLTVTGNQIPASGAVAVTAFSIDILNNAGGSGSCSGTLAGVAGTLSWTTGGGYSFTRTVAGSAVTCYPQTAFIPADLHAKSSDLMVFWLGRNDFAALTDPVALQAAADAIFARVEDGIRALETLKKRFIILGVTAKADVTEYVGTNSYNAKRALAARFAARYPDSFIDIGMILNGSGTGTGQDLTDYNNGVIPTSLRSDLVHLNNTGYGIVATAIKNRITEKGW